jgi:hypothetical protein
MLALEWRNFVNCVKLREKSLISALMSGKVEIFILEWGFEVFWRSLVGRGLKPMLRCAFRCGGHFCPHMSFEFDPFGWSFFDWRVCASLIDRGLIEIGVLLCGLSSLYY